MTIRVGETVPAAMDGSSGKGKISVGAKADAVSRGVASGKGSLLATLGSKYSLEPEKLLETFKATIFDKDATEAEMIAFLSVANKYDLDPFRKEVFAFRRKEGGIQPLVSVDGWAAIANRDPHFDGVEFEDHLEGGLPSAITCRIFRKDRAHPTVVTEYYRECKRNTIPWQVWPARMLRHKAFIQCVRLAFGVSGLMEQDEVDRMVEAESRVVVQQPPKDLEELKKQLQAPATPAKTGRSTILRGGDDPRSDAERKADEEAIASFAAGSEEIEVFQEPEAPSPPPKPLLASDVANQIGQHAVRMGPVKFKVILRKHLGDSLSINYGLGLDALKAVLAECETVP